MWFVFLFLIMYYPNSQPGPADMSTMDFHIVGLPFPHVPYQIKKQKLTSTDHLCGPLPTPTSRFPLPFFRDHGQLSYQTWNLRASHGSGTLAFGDQVWATKGTSCVSSPSKQSLMTLIKNHTPLNAGPRCGCHALWCRMLLQILEITRFPNSVPRLGDARLCIDPSCLQNSTKLTNNELILHSSPSHGTQKFLVGDNWELFWTFWIKKGTCGG